MKAVHVLRKRLSRDAGTVAANVLKYGAGALNIDATRISASPADFAKLAGGVEAIRSRGGVMEGSWKNSSDLSGANPANTLGRWPANVILQHLDGCRQTGTRDEPGYTVNRFTDGAKPFGGGAGHPYESEQVPPSTVPVWACAEGCPVAALDAQSGITKSAVALEVKTSRVKGQFVVNATSIPGVNQHGDTGGASRYFKQTHHKQD